MIDFIPLEYYTDLYFHILLVIVLFTFLHTQAIQVDSNMNVSYMRFTGVFLFVFVLLYMGLRPVSGQYFGDMGAYARYFENYKQGGYITSHNDFGFHFFSYLSSKILGVHAYFLVLAALYIIPLYLVCKKWFGSYWFLAFLLLIGSFSFWAYGTNGIRNGIATSFFLYAISRDKRLFQILWFFLSISFHASLILPAIGFLIANIYNQPKKMITFWILCIPISIVAGGLWETFFANLGFEDDRISYLATEEYDEHITQTGFRWDFLAYSATAVFAGWYYIVKKNYQDKIYFWLFNTFVFTNAFWILVIRANFSNRFAYLSWFMMAIVIIYPLLKESLLKQQYKKIGLILIAYFAFTYIMNILL